MDSKAEPGTSGLPDDEQRKKAADLAAQLREMGLSFYQITCFDCPLNATCEYAWDAYNTDGDCLAMK